MNEIKMWAQMFFHDGSVSQGMRIDARMIESSDGIHETARVLLNMTTRDSGSLMVWGAGNMIFYPRVTISSLGESAISVLES